MPRTRSSRGFTLVELIVVVLIIGVLAAVGIPQYARTMESSKADDAASLVKMIGTTNRMYSLDRGYFTSGDVSNSGACSPPAGSSSVGPATDLTGCKYLATQDWANKAYNYQALNGKAATSGCSLSCSVPGGSYAVACAKRKTSGPGSSSSSVYGAWGYLMSNNGVTVSCGGAPTAPS